VSKQCPECEALGQRSMILPRANQTRGNKAVDEPVETADGPNRGRRHRHDPNTTKRFLRCSKGHQWDDEEGEKCWCGWEPEKESRDRGKEPKRT